MQDTNARIFEAAHNIKPGSVWANRKDGSEVTVASYTRIDLYRGDVRIEGRKTGIELRTFHQEFRAK